MSPTQGAGRELKIHRCVCVCCVCMCTVCVWGGGGGGATFEFTNYGYKSPPASFSLHFSLQLFAFFFILW